jgi:ubiquinone/menaquinone biosynthesis C-methylase UbiE
MTKSMKVTDINKLYGSLDIYLLDAIMKGYFDEKRSVLDIGCGEGRNLTYFLHNNYFVFGIDKNESCIRLCKMMAKSHQSDPAKFNFQCSDASSLPYMDNYFDIVISSAVMHFARDEAEFFSMLSEAVRVLKSQGIIFIRMASTIGIDAKISENGFTFFITRELIEHCLNKFNLEKLEPVKSVNEEDQRVMTTLLLKKK